MPVIKTRSSSVRTEKPYSVETTSKSTQKASSHSPTLEQSNVPVGMKKPLLKANVDSMSRSSTETESKNMKPMPKATPAPLNKPTNSLPKTENPLNKASTSSSAKLTTNSLPKIENPLNKASTSSLPKVSTNNLSSFPQKTSVPISPTKLVGSVIPKETKVAKQSVHQELLSARQAVPTFTPNPIPHIAVGNRTVNRGTSPTKPMLSTSQIYPSSDKNTTQDRIKSLKHLDSHEHSDGRAKSLKQSHSHDHTHSHSHDNAHLNAHSHNHSHSHSHDNVHLNAHSHNHSHDDTRTITHNHTPSKQSSGSQQTHSKTNTEKLAITSTQQKSKEPNSPTSKIMGGKTISKPHKAVVNEIKRVGNYSGVKPQEVAARVQSAPAKNDVVSQVKNMNRDGLVNLVPSRVTTKVDGPSKSGIAKH